MVERAQDVTSFFGRVVTRILSLGNFGPPGTRRTNITPLTSGSPNGQVLDNEGSIVVALNPVGLWQKTSGGYSRTGWTQLAAGSSSSGLAYGLRVVGLETGAHVGAVDSTVLRFANQGEPLFSSLPLADWVVQTNDVNGGTTFQITLPGLYIGALSVPTTTFSQPINGGISIDASGIILTGLPLMGFQDSVMVNFANPDSADPAAPSGTAPIFVTQEMIDAGGGIIRAHAANGAFANETHTGFVLIRAGDARQ
jgi:hypothetical protein